MEGVLQEKQRREIVYTADRQSILTFSLLFLAKTAWNKWKQQQLGNWLCFYIIHLKTRQPCTSLQLKYELRWKCVYQYLESLYGMNYMNYWKNWIHNIDLKKYIGWFWNLILREEDRNIYIHNLKWATPFQLCFVYRFMFCLSALNSRKALPFLICQLSPSSLPVRWNMIKIN